MRDRLQDLLIEELQDLYSAETQIIEALPMLEKEVTTPELKEALKNHLQETKMQVTRLKKSLELLKADVGRKRCKAMEGILAEGHDILREHAKSIVRDAAIIGACQKVEHYEIAGYGTACAHAKLLELAHVEDLLKETLAEEASADKKLSKIAEGSFFTEGVNQKAALS